MQREFSLPIRRNRLFCNQLCFSFAFAFVAVDFTVDLKPQVKSTSKRGHQRDRFGKDVRRTGWSPGLVDMGDNFSLIGNGFESRCHILDGLDIFYLYLL